MKLAKPLNLRITCFQSEFKYDPTRTVFIRDPNPLDEYGLVAHARIVRFVTIALNSAKCDKYINKEFKTGSLIITFEDTHGAQRGNSSSFLELLIILLQLFDLKIATGTQLIGSGAIFSSGAIDAIGGIEEKAAAAIAFGRKNLGTDFILILPHYQKFSIQDCIKSLGDHITDESRFPQETQSVRQSAEWLRLNGYWSENLHTVLPNNVWDCLLALCKKRLLVGPNLQQLEELFGEYADTDTDTCRQS